MGAAAALEQSIEGYTASASVAGSSIDTTTSNLPKPTGAILGPYGEILSCYYYYYLLLLLFIIITIIIIIIIIIYYFDFYLF